MLIYIHIYIYIYILAATSVSHGFSKFLKFCDFQNFSFLRYSSIWRFLAFRRHVRIHRKVSSEMHFSFFRFSFFFCFFQIFFRPIIFFARYVIIARAKIMLPCRRHARSFFLVFVFAREHVFFFCFSFFLFFLCFSDFVFGRFLSSRGTYP